MIWFNVKDKLPEDGDVVIVVKDSGFGAKKMDYHIARFKKGIIEEEWKKRGWFDSSDKQGNNLVPYCWQVNSYGWTIFGQDVTWWMPAPEYPNTVNKGII